jgi:hypothetical protein
MYTPLQNKSNHVRNTIGRGVESPKPQTNCASSKTFPDHISKAGEAVVDHLYGFSWSPLLPVLFFVYIWFVVQTWSWWS